MEELKLTEVYQNSRLGQVLIQKGYISSDMLEAAVGLSQKNNQELGDFLIEQKMISQWQLRRALSSQSKLRLSGCLAIILLSPVTKTLPDGTEQPMDCQLEKLLEPLLVARFSSPLEYDPSASSIEIKDDGIMRLSVPSSFGELNFTDLKLKKSEITDYKSLGLEDIELGDSTLFIRAIHNKISTALPLS